MWSNLIAKPGFWLLLIVVALVILLVLLVRATVRVVKNIEYQKRASRNLILNIAPSKSVLEEGKKE